MSKTRLPWGLFARRLRPFKHRCDPRTADATTDLTSCTMMFRNVQEEEESESDWDDLTPHISPHHQPRPPPLNSPSPQHLSPPPSSTSSHTLIQPEKSLSALPTGASRPEIRKENGTDEAEFDSLSARQNPATPSPLQSSIPQLLPHSKYTLTTSPASPVIPPPLSTTQLPITQGDPPLHPTPPLTVAGRRDESPIDVQADDTVVPHKHGMFEFGVIVDSRQLHVEREKQMHATVMAGLADRSEKMLRRVFQEFFSCLRLCTDLFIVFILECAHCIAFHVLRKLLCGLLFTCLSSLSAPGLTDCYNVVVWPLALCCLQVCRAGGLVLGPCVECLGWAGRWCLEMVTAFRPVNIVLTGQRTPHSQSQRSLQ